MNESPAQSAQRSAFWLGHAPQWASAAVCALVGIALAGWLSGIEVLKSAGQQVPMNPVTALSLLMAGISLWLSRNAGTGGSEFKLLRAVARALGLVVAIVGLLRLLGYWPGWDIGLDTLLFKSRLNGNRIAPNSAFNLLLVGSALLLLPSKSARARRAAVILALIMGGVGVLAVAGYLYRVLSFYEVGLFTPMALNTAAVFLLLSIGIMGASMSKDGVYKFFIAWPFERKVTAGFVVAMLLLAIIGAAARHSLVGFLNGNEADKRTIDTVDMLQELGSDLRDAETGQRGFIITGDEQYLQPYRAAVQSVQRHIGDLRNAMAHDAVQERRLDALNALVMAKMDELQRTIRLRSEKGLSAAVTVIAEGEGKLAMDKMRQLLAEMTSEETSRLNQRQSEEKATAGRTLWTVGLGSVLAIAVVAISAFLVRRDIVARRRAEESLRESEDRFRLLVEGAREYAIFMLDPSGRVRTWNPSAQRLKGYRSEEIIGQHFSRFYPAEDVQRGKPERELKIALEHGKYEEDGWRVRKDGSRFWANVLITRLDDRAGNHIGFSKISRDLTDRKRAEDAISDLNKTLRNGNAQLEAANKELEAFSYSVSHDLRAPLRSLDGFSQVLLEDYGSKLDEEGQDHLHRVRAASQRMGHLIDDLLNLSRFTRMEMSRENADLSKIAREIADEIRGASPERAVDLLIADGLCANADPRLVRVVLNNLLGNAWKFTGKQARARIEFGASETKQGLAYFVRDNGAGFDMAYAGKLFGAFQRLHAMEEFPGTGIGLATVQRIVHRHGGRIWAEGAVGSGATFYFTF